MSHLGRPKEGPEEKFSLKHLVGDLAAKLNTEVLFANDCIGKEAVEKAASLKPGQVLLLENLRSPRVWKSRRSQGFLSHLEVHLRETRRHRCSNTARLPIASRRNLGFAQLLLR